MISVEAWTTIRYLRAGGKGKRAIARELGISRNTVRRALARQGPPRYRRPPRPNEKLVGLEEAIQKMRKQGLVGSRILREIRQRGYRGSRSALYTFLRRLKAEEPDPRVCLRYETQPGQQEQFDWSPYTVELGGELRRVVVFSSALGYSKRKHFSASLDSRQDSVYGAIEEGYWHFDGAARQLLVDNDRSFVIDARPDHFRWNPHFLELCGHYHVQPIACRRFRHLSLSDRVPDSTTLIKLTHKYGEETVHALNDALVLKLKEGKVVRGKNLRLLLRHQVPQSRFTGC